MTNPYETTVILHRCDKDKAVMVHSVHSGKLIGIQRKTGATVTDPAKFAAAAARADAAMVGPATTVRIWRKGSRTYCNNGKGLNMQIHRDPAPAVDAAAEGYKLGHADGFVSGLILGFCGAFILGVAAFILALVFA